ncbi:D-ribose pyranase [Pseudodesulfovibrio sediminis]|uniref:D-ribose pyranase n=1 Tax=Pseudodesulfovibrio sediminis TaxID=2810563 RepID=A0ABN6EXN2_9BACT|nr:D-ribose pyranase [Pseudodesulfovibrio sediminis]BCS89799.1 D-ribose pyranase [Pseudodesulfovibrio sediminis]
MKKAKLINSEISYVIAKLGHFDCLTVCDAGLPVPPGVQRIDLAVTEGVPSFMDTVRAIVSELQIESVELAKEFPQASLGCYQELADFLKQTGVERGREMPVFFVPHEEFKVNSAKSVAIVRTGEFTPYANVTFTSGVVF